MSYYCTFHQCCRNCLWHDEESCSEYWDKDTYKYRCKRYEFRYD